MMLQHRISWLAALLCLLTAGALNAPAQETKKEEKGKTGKFALKMKLASKEEAAEARAASRIEKFADSSPAEQKQIVQEVTKGFVKKGEKLTFKDAQLAAQLAMMIDDSQIDFARATHA